MSINLKSGLQMFRRKFVSGSLFVSPCPPECYLQSETKIEPDLRSIFTQSDHKKEKSLASNTHEQNTAKHICTQLFVGHSFSFSVAEPDPTTINVRNLSKTILITSKPDQYNYLVSWEMPFLKESRVNKYVITCSLSGNPDRAERWQIITVVHIDFVASASFLSFSCSRIGTVGRALDC